MLLVKVPLALSASSLGYSTGQYNRALSSDYGWSGMARFLFCEFCFMGRRSAKELD